MQNSITTKHIPTISFNLIDDKNNGDFDSAFWKNSGMDRLRDPLFHYFSNFKNKFINASINPDYQKQNLLRNTNPNNCFSYASDMIIHGDHFFCPSFFKYIDLNSSQSEYYIPRNDDFLYSILDTNIFKENLALGGINELTDPARQPFYNNLIIGMTNENFCDYHFFKIFFRVIDKKPRLFFDEKPTIDDAVKFNQSLEVFSSNYKSYVDSYYEKPVIYLPSKDLVDKHVISHSLRSFDHESIVTVK